MSIWNYIFAGCMIALGLIFTGIMLIAFIARQQERAARKKPRHECDPSKSWTMRDSRGNALATVCPECEERVAASYPTHVLMADTRPMEER